MESGPGMGGMNGWKKQEWILFLCAMGLLWWGWHTFLFVTDDAYIIFRYAAQRQAGHGYVWNAPPFLPVEGYSCFAWLVLLDLLTAWTSWPIEHVANGLSLMASVGILWIFASMARRVIGKAETGMPGTLYGLALFFLASDRLFLTWTSSGLETALFNLCVLGWVYWTWPGMAPVSRTQALRIQLILGGLISLIRPDGYLFLASSCVLNAHAMWKRREGENPPRTVDFWPVLAILGHVVWRKLFYGEWLPNTYFAKVVGPLPDIGFRYLYSFSLEHGLWLIVPVFGLALFRRIRGATGGSDRVAHSVLWGTLVAHTLYYAGVAGGDHFEYRILSHWSPLLALGVLATSITLGKSAIIRVGVFSLLLLVHHLLPWIHFGVSQEHTQWSRTMPSYPVAPELPEWMRGLGEELDDTQQWLFRHAVGMRHQHHKLFSAYQRAQLPSREAVSAGIGEEVNPVVVVTSAGIAGWRFLDAHVIDLFGLNDYVTARTPPRTAESARIVAHARQAPPEYVDAFRPNMVITPSRVSPFRSRPVPLTDAEIVSIEKRFRESLPADRNTPQSETGR